MYFQTITSLFSSLKKERITKNEERGTRRTGSGERGTGNGETENRERATAKGERRAENGVRRTEYGERRTEDGTQGTGTRNQGPNTGNGKIKMEKKNLTPKLNQQIITHSLSCSHFLISCIPFSVLVTPAPYNMNHQIPLMALFATRSEGVKQGNKCTDAFLFISSKRFLSYFFVLKSKGLYIYLVGW